MGNEEELLHRLVRAFRQDRRIVLVLGSGICAPVIPGVRDMVRLADEFASQAIGNTHLAAALAEVRAETRDRLAETYAAYRRTFAEWVSPTEFDIVMQHAVLTAYRPSENVSPAWERIGFHRGASLEADQDAWRLPAGVEALGVLLTHLPDRFGHRVLTTNFDPLIEIAVNRAGGQARSRSLDRDGTSTDLSAARGQVDVVHLHGYWRPIREAKPAVSLHDPDPLLDWRPTLTREVAGLMRDAIVCVVGYGGWDDLLTQALDELQTARQVDVLWAQHATEELATAAASGPGRPTLSIPLYRGVDSNRLFPNLQSVLLPDLRARPSVPQPRGPAGPEPRPTGYRYRVPALEQSLGARLDPDELLRQLDREFGWVLDRVPGAPLEVVFWPVQLRAPTLIYAVQALVAAALSAREAEVILLYDDLTVDATVSDLRRRFTQEVKRWFTLIDRSRPPRVESLLAFCDPGFVAQRLLDPELAARPTHPWAVEREYYAGERTVYEVARAAKVIPDSQAHDAVDSEVKRGLTTTHAKRLISTPAIWSYLHYVLRNHPAESVLTLGGADELIMWRSWHQVFPEPVNHVYNPRMVDVRQDATVLVRRSFGELVDALTEACRLPEWDQPGQYVHWTANNAVLLAQYLGVRPSSTGRTALFESWQTIEAALRADPSRTDAIKAIAREVSALMLHDLR